MTFSHEVPGDDRIDTSKENEHVKEMIEWFLDRYEDPVENCPVDGGEYVFIYGGPHDPQDVLESRFEKADQVDVERAVSLLCNFCSGWSGLTPQTNQQVAKILGIDDLDVEALGDELHLDDDSWSTEDIVRAESLLDDRQPPLIRPRIQRLVRRGNVTPDEIAELRCNSYEWEALVPVLTNEAFIKRVRHAIGNCSIKQERPFVTYNDAVIGLYSLEALDRLGVLHDEATVFADVIDRVRAALGQKNTHYLVIADDVKTLVDAVEREDPNVKEILRKIRESPGAIDSCQACYIEAEIGTEENPHPVPARFHTCRR